MRDNHLFDYQLNRASVIAAFTRLSTPGTRKSGATLGAAFIPDLAGFNTHAVELGLHEGPRTRNSGLRSCSRPEHPTERLNRWKIAIRYPTGLRVRKYGSDGRLPRAIRLRTAFSESNTADFVEFR